MSKFTLKKPLTFKEIEELAEKIYWLEDHRRNLKRLIDNRDILSMDIEDKKKNIKELEKSIFGIIKEMK